MPKHAKKKEEPFEVELTPRQTLIPKRKRNKPSEKKQFVPPDPRCEDCFYWRPIAEASNYMRCCHYLLRTGERRNAISETKCGSFQDRETAPKERFMFTDVPVTQWGCPEMIDWKSQR